MYQEICREASGSVIEKDDREGNNPQSITALFIEPQVVLQQ